MAVLKAAVFAVAAYHLAIILAWEALRGAYVRAARRWLSR